MIDSILTHKDVIVNSKISEEFTLKNATLYGGYNLFSDFLQANGLDALLEKEFSGEKAEWSDYSLPLVCRLVIGGYALGLPNLYTFSGLEHDPVLAGKHGLSKLPHQTVLRKDLIRHFRSDEDVQRLRRIKVRQVGKILKRDKRPLVLEFDSTVETGYGTQEGLKVGYNPHKHGRASYHPQLCRERHDGLSVWSRLRPGNTVSLTDFTDFLDETWEVLPWRFKRRHRDGLCRVLFRQDSGYESEDAFAWNEANHVGYVTKMKNRSDIVTTFMMMPSSSYRSIETSAGEIEVASCRINRDAWSKARRVVAVRWKEDVDRAQGMLMDGFGYTYVMFVTNLDWDEEDIYRFYDMRADIENHIREGKQDFSLGHISTDHFYANAADMELRLLAMNQVILFTKYILKKSDPRHFASTVRRHWFWIPGKLIRRGGRWVLKLADWWPHGEEWSVYRQNIMHFQME